MTCREKLKLESLELTEEELDAYCREWCGRVFNDGVSNENPCPKWDDPDYDCKDCWDREYVRKE